MVKLKKNKRGRDKFRKAKWMINITSFILKIFGKRGNKLLYNVIYHRKSKIMMGIRYSILKNLVNNIGENVSVHHDVKIINFGKIKLGDNISIHPYSYLDGYGGIDVNNDVSIAHGTSIVSFEHKYEMDNIPIKDQGLVEGKIIIEDNCWIGAKSTILSNVTIRKGTIVAAGSVVTKTFNDNVIIAGVPAKVIRKRTKEDQSERKNSNIFS